MTEINAHNVFYGKSPEWIAGYERDIAYEEEANQRVETAAAEFAVRRHCRTTDQDQ